MGRIFDHITELIGSTPLLRIHRLNDGRADVLAKVEYLAARTPQVMEIPASSSIKTPSRKM